MSSSAIIEEYWILVLFYSLPISIKMIKIHIADYKNPEQTRLLEGCLKNWFRNPKDLNLTSPKTRYPFKFRQWKKKFYSDSDTLSCVVLNNKLIVGHVSLRFSDDRRRGHIFHLIIAPEYRGQGYARKLINYLENIASELKLEKLTLNVNPGNQTARQLYDKLGYSTKGKSGLKSITMQKVLTN